MARRINAPAVGSLWPRQGKKGVACLPQSLALLISAAAEVGGARRHLAETPAVALGWLPQEAFPTVQKVPSGGGRGLSLSQAFGIFIPQQDQIFL